MRIGVFLFELSLLRKIREGREEFLLTTRGDWEKHYAIKLYEAHGFKVLRDTEGFIIYRVYGHRRLDSQFREDPRPYYYATASNVLEAVGLLSA